MEVRRSYSLGGSTNQLHSLHSDLLLSTTFSWMIYVEIKVFRYEISVLFMCSFYAL